MEAVHSVIERKKKKSFQAFNSSNLPKFFFKTDRLPIFVSVSVFPDSLQAQLINMGVIPTLVKLLGIHSHNTALTEMCLIAFGNLAELGEYI